MDNQSVLTVEQRKKISLTNVQSVDAFSDEKIVLSVGGQKVVIEGSSLKVLAFSQGSGSFAASGEVRLIKYGTKNKLSSLLK